MSIKNINNRSIIIASTDIEKLESEIFNILEKTYPVKLGDNLNQIKHPDIIFVSNTEEKDSIGIEEIQKAKAKLSLKPYQSETITLIIYPSEKITIEAQNAFLKILEEPPKYALIILATHNTDNLLDTVKSRCFCYIFENTKNNQADYNISSLLQLNIVERFKLVEKINTDKHKKKKFQQILVDLEKYYHHNMINHNDEEYNLVATKNSINLVQEAKSLIQKNVNPRVVMENLMLNI